MSISIFVIGYLAIGLLSWLLAVIFAPQLKQEGLTLLVRWMAVGPIAILLALILGGVLLVRAAASRPYPDAA